LGHHDLAEFLADAGFVVAAINHPGDTFSDMSRAADISEFVERPTDIKRLVDFMLNDAPDAAKIDATKIGFFGFSRGGYTGLVLAGGSPDFADANVPCTDLKLPICREIKHQPKPLKLARDDRIKAYVLADPLNEFPRPSKRGSAHSALGLAIRRGRRAARDHPGACGCTSQTARI
jgi:predicted dienelactone hydrolase